jgi:deoxycytidine triphosphate deaminase
MILAYTELKTLVQDRMMRPVPDLHINASSVDVVLGDTVQEEIHDPALADDELTVVELGKREKLGFTEHSIRDEPFLLYPGAFVLAHTREKFYLPLDISAEFRLKSSVARMGLGHVLAVWCDPGWNDSVLTLELHNVSQHHIISLRAGDRVGQMIFHRHVLVPKARSYAAVGAYNGDASAQPTKGAKP